MGLRPITMDSIPRYGLPLWRSYNFPIAMGKERGDGGSRDPRDLGPAACHHPLIKALAHTARAFAFVRAFDLTRTHPSPGLLPDASGSCP